MLNPKIHFKDLEKMYHIGTQEAEIINIQETLLLILIQVRDQNHLSIQNYEEVIIKNRMDMPKEKDQEIKKIQNMISRKDMSKIEDMRFMLHLLIINHTALIIMIDLERLLNFIKN